MAIFPREDPRTTLPQLEKYFGNLIKDVNGRIDYTQKVESVTPTAYLCSLGTANACYKMGKIVLLSFNINVTTSATATAYLKNIPKPIHNFACCSSTARFRVDTSGELVSEEAPGTGWHNGSVVYICEEK